MRLTLCTLCWALLVLSGCDEGSPAVDSAPADSAPADSAAADLASPDLALTDLAPPDSIPADLASPDSIPADSIPADLASPDLASPDLGAPDSGVPPISSPPPRVAARDYAYWYWPGNHRPTETWPKVEHEQHFLTGCYGMAFNQATGQLTHLGPLASVAGYVAARLTPNAVVNKLPAAALRFEAGAKGVVATTFLGHKDYTVDRTRMVDGGRFMNRLVIPTVRYAADKGLTGEVQIASMPRHVVWTHTVKGSSANAKVARVSLGGAALSGYKTVTWLAPGRALRLANGAGAGWVFVVADDKEHALSLDAKGAVVAQRAVKTAPAAGVAVSLLMAPSQALSAEELALYLNPAKQVQASYTLLDLFGKPVGKAAAVPWDPTLGAFRVTLRPIYDTGAPKAANYAQAKFHNWYGRHRLELKRASAKPVSVPLALHGPHKISWYITGGMPLWRDVKGNPLGIGLQISKNWHGQTWYHLYSQPTLAAKGTTALELTVASSRWGKIHAASHAQLSLVGWNNAGGHWDESALGAFGESVTYDPDMTLRRAMVDDVRPFLVQSKTKWSWTGNVGGADFLRYRTAAKSYWQRRLARVRSVYRAVGPNLTDVAYTGVSTDGAILGDVRTQLVGTDDVVRVYFHLDYTFLEDVDYHTLAFFQVAADNYADNGFSRYAYGDAAGKHFEGKLVDHKSKGYASDAHRGIAVAGKAPWVLLFDNKKTGGNLPEHYANVGFVVRRYELKVGGKTLTTPSLNISRTNNGQSQMAFQLGVPHQKGAAWCGAPCKGKQRFIPKGSRLQATVEYLVLPADKTRYYGNSAYLKATPAAHFASHQLMRRMAADNRLQVQATVGTLQRAQPVEVLAAPGIVAADLTVEGGLGYTPLTVRGLSRHDGWWLQRRVGGAWVKVDQAVHGADYWQAGFDPQTSSWSLTFSVANNGKQRYRLLFTGK